MHINTEKIFAYVSKDDKSAVQQICEADPSTSESQLVREGLRWVIKKYAKRNPIHDGTGRRKKTV